MKYVLITPARNEELFIEKTVTSMLTQTLTPKRWIIVDDGSTDKTAEIVRNRAGKCPWIELVQRPQRLDRRLTSSAIWMRTYRLSRSIWNF